MLTVKFVKYDRTAPQKGPASVQAINVRQAAAVHLVIEKDGRQAVQCGDAPGETYAATVGPGADCAYDVAYVMNDAGRTVETIR